MKKIICWFKKLKEDFSWEALERDFGEKKERDETCEAEARKC